MNKLAALVIGCSAAAMVGCSSDDDPVAVTTDNYSVTFTNLSTGQPMTPPVVAIHDASVNLFRIGSAASPQLQAIAENGNNDPMVELAGSLSQVSAAGVAAPAEPGPLLPQQTSTILLENGLSNHVFSAVNMVVCTNDGFSGVDSVSLPTGTETLTLMKLPYDAGTEENILMADYWVPPCGGTGNLHTDEAGVITAHPGQTGVGDFNFVGTDPILMIEITRQ